ncbi:MAG: DUF6090 family protein [Gemmatimonadota bacterium]|jgi:hypothetical protein
MKQAGRVLDWRHAAGELVLIVVGILIALAASEWQNDRAERRTEIALLEELEHGLTTDITSLNGMLERYRGTEDRVSRLLGYMQAGGEYSDTLEAYFGAAYGFQSLDLNRAGYESLKSQGLDLVSDATLRSRIAQVYEQAYPRIEASVRMERNVVLEVLRPYFLRHFRNLRFGLSAEPIDYRALLADDEFLNLLDYRRQVVAQNHITRFTEAIPQLEALRTRIREALRADGGD